MTKIMRLFSPNSLTEKFASSVTTITNNINKYGSSTLLLEAQKRLSDQLLKDFTINLIEIDEDNITNKIIERVVTLRSGKAKEEGMRYVIPFRGDQRLFSYAAKNHPPQYLLGEIKDNNIWLDLFIGAPITGNASAHTKLAQEILKAVAILKDRLKDFNNEVAEYNKHLPEIIQIKISEKIENLKKSEEAIDSSNPFKKNKPSE